jgi:hypothetical protein
MKQKSILGKSNYSSTINKSFSSVFPTCGRNEGRVNPSDKCGQPWLLDPQVQERLFLKERLCLHSVFQQPHTSGIRISVAGCTLIYYVCKTRVHLWFQILESWIFATSLFLFNCTPLIDLLLASNHKKLLGLVST